MGNLQAKNYALEKVQSVLETYTTLTGSTTQIPLNYKLGDEVDIWDDTKNFMTKYVLVYARNALLQYGLYEITYSGTAYQEVGALLMPNSTISTYTLMCVPQVACASGSYCWAAIEGPCNITSTGNAVKGEYGSAVKNIATATDSGATLTTHSVCEFSAARTGSGTVACNLLGNRVVVA